MPSIIFRHGRYVDGGPDLTAVFAMVPHLTHCGAALKDDLVGKVKTLLSSAAGPGVDKETVATKLAAADPGARGLPGAMLKLLGSGMNAKIDTADEAYHESFNALCAAALGPEERKMISREMPRLRQRAQFLLQLRSADKVPEDEILAILFAWFFNGRNDEGLMGENLHIGVRRLFERFFALYSGLQSTANRVGIYRASDLFEPAFQASSPLGRSPLNEQGPGMAGETAVLAPNRLKKV